MTGDEGHVHQARGESVRTDAPVRGVGVARLDPDGLLLEADAGLCRLTGHEAHELVGRTFAALTASAAEAARWHRVLQQAQDGAAYGLTDLVFTARAGESLPRPVQVAWSADRRADGRRELTAFCVDRSDDPSPTPHWRSLLRQHEIRFRARFEQSAVPQTFCDLGGVLTEVNAAFCRLLGVPAAAVLGRPLDALSHHTDAGTADRALARLLRGEVTTAQAERVWRRSDGRPLPTLINATLLRDPEGEPTGVAAFVQDLSNLRDAEQRHQQQLDFFLALSQRASDLALVTDVKGVLLYASPALTSMLGYAEEDVLGEETTAFLHPDDADQVQRIFVAVVQEGRTETVRLRVRDAAGAWRWMEETGANMLHTAVGGVVFNLRDVSEQVRAEEALRASESRYRAIADNADEGLWLTDATGASTYVNQRLVEILGRPERELLGRTLDEVLPGERRTLARAPLPDAPPGHRATRYEVDYEHPDGRTRVLSVSEGPLAGDRSDDRAGEQTDEPTDGPHGGPHGTRPDPALEGSLAMLADVTDAWTLRRELEHAALHDALTKLPNRALLMDRLDQALARCPRRTAVLFLDLDRFKLLNDARGHAAGDEVLVGLAARMRVAVRPVDTVARFAGDEFVVVCEDVDAAEATELARQLMAALEQPLDVEGGQAHLTVSIGVAVSAPSGAVAPAASAEALLQHADTAMYAAKVAGRGRVRVFDEALAADAEERFELGTDLRTALVEDRLDLHYQPVVDLRTGEVLGAEALARWEHPVHGRVPPDRFVPVAEDAGIAAHLDRWALHRAVGDLAALRRAGTVGTTSYVAVNLSSSTLADPALEDWVLEGVSRAGLEPADVVLELTERAIMTDTESVAARLGRLRDCGVGIAVDDFGTGHSSMAYLRRLPLTVLKIDRSFVVEIASDASALAIATSIVELARAVGVTVVAEGVESQRDAELLRGIGCDAGQGWLWSPAVPVSAAHDTGALRRTYL